MIYAIISAVLIFSFMFLYMRKKKVVKKEYVYQPVHLTGMEKDILTELNHVRVKEFKIPLQSDRTLREYCYHRLDDLILNFDHKGFAAVNKELKFMGFNLIGENLGYKIGTAKGLITAWSNSKRHNRNMLNDKFTMCGIGYKKYKGENYYCLLLAN